MTLAFDTTAQVGDQSATVSVSLVVSVASRGYDKQVALQVTMPEPLLAQWLQWWRSHYNHSRQAHTVTEVSRGVYG